MIGQIKNIISSFFYSIASLKSGAIKYILITGFIALLIFGVMIWGAWMLAGYGASIVAVLTPWQWANESTLLSFIIGLGLIIGFILILKYILLIALSPLLSYISEKAEKSLNREYDIRGFSAATSAARSVRINMRNMVKEIFLTILLLIAGLIPGLNLIAIPLLFIVQAYFTGFGIMDFYLERHMTFRETLGEVYRHKYASIILGGIFMLLFAIPVLGAIVAPYLTTVAGTQYFLKNRLNLQPTTYHLKPNP
jgi:CysZ protein